MDVRQLCFVFYLFPSPSSITISLFFSTHLSRETLLSSEFLCVGYYFMDLEMTGTILTFFSFSRYASDRSRSLHSKRTVWQRRARTLSRLSFFEKTRNHVICCRYTSDIETTGTALSFIIRQQFHYRQFCHSCFLMQLDALFSSMSKSFHFVKSDES